MATDASPPLYTLRGVVKRFARGAEEVTALREVDLTIARGELLLVMGPSGSGKSTLLHLLGGLDRPTAGSVEFRPTRDAAPLDLGVLADEPLAEMRRRALGFVFQEFHLLPTLSALENVMLPLLLEDGRGGDRGGAGGIRGAAAAARARAHARLVQVGLDTRADHLPDQLSGGERQRVAIARALVADPPVLLCDEPTGSLDSARGREILTLLHELTRRELRTVVIVTHDANAIPFADRLLTLRDGALGETAS